MNRRQRFIETMTFGSPDRPASADYFYYDSTRLRWESEGMPKNADPLEYFDMDFDPFRWKIPHPEIFPIVPDFGTTVLEENDDIKIVRRPEGEIVRILKNVPPPAMPQWISYPCQTIEDWKEHKKRLDPGTPERLPANFLQLAEEYKKRDYPLGMWLGGTYGYLRNWWGVENLSLLFYDNPALIEEMIEHLTNFALRFLNRVLSFGIQLDWVMFWEDMGYKTASLLSPTLYKKYCVPYYMKVMEKVRAANVPVVMLDSDGSIWELIPIWLDLGINIMHPMEVAAGMDVMECRKKYGKKIGFFGGIDKRALAGSRQQLKAEVLPKLEYCLKDGGFVPACDHAIPPDVPFDNYLYFRELIQQVSDKYYS